MKKQDKTNSSFVDLVCPFRNYIGINFFKTRNQYFTKFNFLNFKTSMNLKTLKYKFNRSIFFIYLCIY